MFQAIWVIIGSLIGAGFASGKEIYYFFYQYGTWGVLGIGIASFLFGWMIRKTFFILEQKPQIRNYREFLEEMIGKKKKMSIIHKMINIFMLIEFYIMIAGFGAYMKQEMGIPSVFGAIFLSLCTYFTCLKSMEGIKKANKIVIPILILFILHIGVQNVESGMVKMQDLGIEFSENGILAIGNAILYTSYNGILLMPVLIGLKREQEKRNNTKIAAISAIFIGILAMCIFQILRQGTREVCTKDIPIIPIIRKLWKILSSFLWYDDCYFYLYLCHCDLLSDY